MINRYIWWRYVAQHPVINSWILAAVETLQYGSLDDKDLDNLEVQTQKPLALKAYNLRSWFLLAMWVLVLIVLIALSCI